MKAKQDPVVFVNSAIRFLITCSPQQIRYDPKKCKSPQFSLSFFILHHFVFLVKLVCETLTDLAVDNKVAIRVLKALKASIWKIGGEGFDPLLFSLIFLHLFCLFDFIVFILDRIRLPLSTLS